MKTTRRKKMRRIRRKTIGGNPESNTEPDPELDPVLESVLEPEVDTEVDPVLEQAVDEDEEEEEDEEEAIPIKPEYSKYVEYFNNLFPDSKTDEEYFVRFFQFIECIDDIYFNNINLVKKIDSNIKNKNEEKENVIYYNNYENRINYRKYRDELANNLKQLGIRNEKKYIKKYNKHDGCRINNYFLEELFKQLSGQPSRLQFGLYDNTVHIIISKPVNLFRFQSDFYYNLKKDFKEYKFNKYDYFIILIKLLDKLLINSMKRCVSSIRKIDHFDRLMESTIKCVNKEGGRKTRRKQRKTKKRKTKKQRK